MVLRATTYSILSDVLQTSKQHLLFSNSISTGLKGNVTSSGLTYAMPLPVIVWHRTKDVLLGFSTKDMIPVWLGNILTLFLATNGIEICCINNYLEALSCHADSCTNDVCPNTILYGHSESQTSVLI